MGGKESVRIGIQGGARVLGIGLKKREERRRHAVMLHWFEYMTSNSAALSLNIHLLSPYTGVGGEAVTRRVRWY